MTIQQSNVPDRTTLHKCLNFRFHTLCTTCHNSFRPSPLACRSNHTKWFWRDRRRAYDEQSAVRLIEPALEDAYAEGGELRPVGPDFKNGCLQDKKDENGTTVYNSRFRAAIQVIKEKGATHTVAFLCVLSCHPCTADGTTAVTFLLVPLRAPDALNSRLM